MKNRKSLLEANGMFIGVPQTYIHFRVAQLSFKPRRRSRPTIRKASQAERRCGKQYVRDPILYKGSGRSGDCAGQPPDKQLFSEFIRMCLKYI
ncbi:hypothetical protein KIN20_007859 [Parelaphostrongylus tenuis]|uniref:Uncharacterized protein n=1 Tax=Parelaphostrongylus tenuis TaxID=148309 RepID=A0AAD5MW19_PARTN|nr:hypothetical protein KIN20_007859 [Parelaphostrongylus tenuis]